VTLLVETFGRNQTSRGVWRANSETGLHRNSVQVAFKVSILSLIVLSSGILFFPFSEEDTIKALIAAYGWLYWMTEGKHLFSDCFTLPVCGSCYFNLLNGLLC